MRTELKIHITAILASVTFATLLILIRDTTGQFRTHFSEVFLLTTVTYLVLLTIQINSHNATEKIAAVTIATIVAVAAQLTISPYAAIILFKSAIINLGYMAPFFGEDSVTLDQLRPIDLLTLTTFLSMILSIFAFRLVHLALTYKPTVQQATPPEEEPAPKKTQAYVIADKEGAPFTYKFLCAICYTEIQLKEHDYCHQCGKEIHLGHILREIYKDGECIYSQLGRHTLKRPPPSITEYYRVICQIQCPNTSCNADIHPHDNYCSNCGKELREKWRRLDRTR